MEIKEFSDTLKLFQKIHPECPFMYARFSAGSNKVGLYYMGGCYINDYQHTFDDVLKMMKEDIAAAEHRLHQTAGRRGSKKSKLVMPAAGKA